MATGTTDKLHDTTLRNKVGKAPSKATKLADGGGLFALWTTSGSILWRMKFRIAGVEQKLAFGAYPDVSLTQARAKRDDARALIANGIDPRSIKAAPEPERAPTFREIAADLMAELKPSQDAKTTSKWEIQLGGHAVDQFGKRAIGDVTAIEVRDWLVKTFQATGRLHTMHETKRKVAAVFGRAAYQGLIPGNPLDTYALSAMRLKAAKDKGHKAITKDPARFGELLRAINAHRGDPSVRGALQFIALTTQRPHMIREARWSQINWTEKVWEIDAVDMKGTEDQRRDHIVPLTDQALAVLRAMLPISGGEDRDGRPRQFVFPGRFGDQPMSNATMNKAIRDMGFDDHVSHGFRASFNTFAKERLGFGHEQDLIDLCLAHVVGSTTRRAYDRAELIADRRALFARWADWLDELRGTSAKVVALAVAA